MDRNLLNLQGRLAAFLRDVEASQNFNLHVRPITDPSEKYRFPGAPEKSEAIRFQVLNPISSGTDPDDRLDFVRNYLRKAKELVADFEDIANKFGRRAAEKRLQQMALDREQQATSNQSQQLAFRPSSTSLAPQPLTQANAASSDGANANAANANPFIPASSLSRIPKPLPNVSAHAQLSSNEGGRSHNTQQFQDDGSRDNVQNLLALSEVDISPSRRRQTPKQMSCALTEHQRIGLTWLLEQENDRQKKGGLLAGI